MALNVNSSFLTECVLIWHIMPMVFRLPNNIPDQCYVIGDKGQGQTMDRYANSLSFFDGGYS